MAKVSGRERQEQIKQYIENNGKATITELSVTWKVTEETIRRDLDKLEAEGLVTRIHGGVIWNINRNTENIHFYERQRKNIQEKRAIADKAVELLKHNSPLFADSSTTVVEAMKALKDEPNLMVVTNSSELFSEIKTWKFGIICTGGVFNEKSMSFQGEMAKNVFRSYNARLAVISCKGLRLDGGIYDSYESEAEIKRVMLENAEKVALLVDHTKFDNKAFLKLTDISHIDYLITDKKPSDEWMDFCADHQVQVIF
ncbi:MAG: DeoR/GlpR family DNA-binding transcription regulator [Eubacterium sp.]